MQGMHYGTSGMPGSLVWLTVCPRSAWLCFRDPHGLPQLPSLAPLLCSGWI